MKKKLKLKTSLRVITKNMNISLCMIVKNEEKILDNCLKSIENYVDETIIVDTGSIDKTKEIASMYTKKIYDFTWCDDFSAARNFSISKAKNDWILVLDADEVLKSFNETSLEKFMKVYKKGIGRIKIINKTIEKNGDENEIIHYVGRVFNKKYYEYTGIIHEQLKGNEDIEQKFIDLDIQIEHIGYLSEVLVEKDKLQRNINIIKKAIKSNPKDSYMFYQLGKSYYLEKNYCEAIKSFEESLNIGEKENYEYIEDLIETYGYALLNSQQYSKAMNILDYNDLYESFPDYNFLAGLIYMNNGMFKEAIASYEKCTKSSRKPKSLGVDSYKAYYNIGIIYECLGLGDQAKHYYKKCGDYRPAIERLNSLLNK